MRCALRDRLRAVHAPRRLARDVGEALGAFLGGNVMRFPAEQRPRLHDEEEHREGDEYERDDGVDEVAVHEAATVQRENEPAEVRCLDHRRDERREEVGDERIHDGAEGCADHDADRQIDGVPAEHKLFEFFEHVQLSIRHLVDLSGIGPEIRLCHSRALPLRHRPLTETR